MLDFSGSEIAASAIILAINQGRMADMVEKSCEVSQNFFFGTKNDHCMVSEPITKPKYGSVKLNTDIWNNKKVAQMTGYTIEMLKQPLYELSVFIKHNLVPNNLNYMDLEGIKGVQNNIYE